MVVRQSLSESTFERERGTSNKVRSVPPVMFHTIPVALSMPISNKGDWMAFNAASRALVFPIKSQNPKLENYKKIEPVVSTGVPEKL